MKQRKLSRWLIAILVVCLASSFVLAACDNNNSDPSPTYYLSIDGATYDNAGKVPSNVKFAKSGSVYTLTVGLEAGQTLTVNKVGSTDKLGWNELFSKAEGKLTQGTGNTLVVAEKGTFVITLDPAESELTYSFTSANQGGGTSVTGVTLDKTELQLALGETAQLVATIVPSTALIKDVTWTSGNNSIASVTQEGVVTANGYGSTTIKVTTLDGNFTESCTVSVSQNVASISLSKSNLTVYVGDGATAQTLEVVFNPANATNQKYYVSVQQDGEYITYTTSGNTISVTGVAQGTATLKVTADEDSSLTASCAITVADIANAVPTLAKDTVVVNLGGDSTVDVLIDGALEITNISATSNAATIATVAKAESGNAVVVTGVKYGATTVTVSVSYGDSKTASLTLNVIVADASFVLEGTVDGTSNWEVTTGNAAALGRLFNSSALGVYTLTRHFSAGDSFHIYPNGSYANEMFASDYYVAGADASYGVGKSGDSKNVTIQNAGYYTLTLDFTGSKVTWTVTVESIDITSATATSSVPSLQVGKTTSATLTLAIKPDVAKVAAGDIDWSVKEDAYSSWLTLTKDTSTGLTCGVALTDKFNSTTEVTVTIVVTVTVDGAVAATAECQLSLLPEGAKETPVTFVDFDQSSYAVNITESGWTCTVSAHVDNAATIKGVTYELVADEQGNPLGSVLVNGDNGAAFAIDSVTGVITARMFGTVWVKATSEGNGSSGAPVSNVTSVTFYADEFYLDINWKIETSNPAEKLSDTSYKWEEVELTGTSAQPVVITYKGLGDDWTSVIRSYSYVDKSSNNVSGTNGNKSGNFYVTKAGVYNIYLDLSGLNPSVKIEWAHEIEVSSFQMTVYIYGDPDWDGGDAYASATETLDPAGNLTVTITTGLTGLPAWGKIGFVTSKDGGSGSWYSNGVSNTTVALSGSKYSNSWTNSSGKLISDGTCQLGYNSGSASTGATTFTFVFTFDDLGTLTAISIN